VTINADVADRWTTLAGMSAERLIEQPEADLVHLTLERYWNDGSPSGHQLGMPIQWAPSNQLLGYALSTMLVPCVDVTVVEPPHGRSDFARRDEAAAMQRFPLHPVMAEELASSPPLHGSTGPMLSEHYVVPTASGRTVAVLNTGGQITNYLKLAYPRPLGRFSRDLSLFKWMASLERSAMFHLALMSDLTATFLPDDGGGYLEGSRLGHGIGFLERSRLEQQRAELLVPAFALSAAPPSGVGTVLLALQRLAGWSPDDLVELLIDQLVLTYLNLALNHGLMPELNAQNLLYVIDRETGTCRVCIRDMQDVFVDDHVRQAVGLPTGGVAYKRLSHRSQDLLERRSFSYDFKLGEYVLGPLSSVIANVAGRPWDLSGHVRSLVRQLAGDAEYWPSDGAWYAYPDTAGVGRSSYQRRENPRWR
jgi:hypothetical protein